MLIEALQNEAQLTDAERAIARFALAHPDEVWPMTTQELAEATATSKASVVRLCHKVGAESFQDFKLRLRDESTSRTRARALLGEEPIGQGTSYEQILQVLPALYESSVSATAERLDKRTVVRAASRILKARKVELYGTGIAHTCAELAAFKFEVLGIPCSVRTSLDEHHPFADEHIRETVAIVFSFTGANLSAERIAHTMVEGGYYVLGIGGNYEAGCGAMPAKPCLVREACTDYLEIGTLRSLSALDVLQSFQSTSYLIDVLFCWMLAKKYDHQVDVVAQALETSRERDAVLAELAKLLKQRNVQDGAAGRKA